MTQVSIPLAVARLIAPSLKPFVVTTIPRFARTSSKLCFRDADLHYIDILVEVRAVNGDEDRCCSDGAANAHVDLSLGAGLHAANDFAMPHFGAVTKLRLKGHHQSLQMLPAGDRHRRALCDPFMLPALLAWTTSAPTLTVTRQCVKAPSTLGS